jgi:hypothetical protein
MPKCRIMQVDTLPSVATGDMCLYCGTIAKVVSTGIYICPGCGSLATPTGEHGAPVVCTVKVPIVKQVKHTLDSTELSTV